MSGRVVMVTGANAGMGKEIVFALAGMGATVVMVCRDSGRGEAARREVQERSGSGDVELLVADLSSQQSIRNLVSEFAASHDRLHVLVKNAGITQPWRIEMAVGVESVLESSPMATVCAT